jgi:hypothetical protein
MHEQCLAVDNIAYPACNLSLSFGIEAAQGRRSLSNLGAEVMQQLRFGLFSRYAFWFMLQGLHFGQLGMDDSPPG